MAGGGKGAVRRSLVLLLLVFAGALVFLAFAFGRRLLFEEIGFGVEYLWLILPLFLGLGSLWVLFTLLDQHFDDIERLRLDLLSSAHTGAELPAHWSDRPDAGAEVTRLAQSLSTLLGSRRVAAEAPSERLSAVVGAAPSGIIVVTESGLVSLANAAALASIDAQAIAVGTSIYAAFERHALVKAWEAAQEAGHPVEAELPLVDGSRLRVSVADLDHHGGCVITFPGTARPSKPEVQLDLALHDRVPEIARCLPETPLRELCALILDTETTGLDVREVRTLSIGAVRVCGLRVFPSHSVDAIVDPGVPIPKSSTAIHGITDEMVAGKGSFPETWPEVHRLLGEGALIGHNIAFDISILRREAERANLEWRSPPALDTGHLMAALRPDLKELDLDVIAAELGVEIEGRHTALGDALVTAEVFTRLIPRLEDRGVHSFAEAQAFARQAANLRRLQNAHGWDEI